MAADWNTRHFPSKCTLGSSLIYVTPLLWFFWLGGGWKWASVLTIATGIWQSPGYLRRGFGVAFLLSLLIWGTHAYIGEGDWPGHPLLLSWWVASWGTRCHADGVQAEAAAQQPEREWE